MHVFDAAQYILDTPDIDSEPTETNLALYDISDEEMEEDCAIFDELMANFSEDDYIPWDEVFGILTENKGIIEKTNDESRNILDSSLT